ncbi:MAG: PEP-CTERM sorting domain-containing protein [Rhodocyclaceae bacterium]|nr:PEP-CTERM sorting domain-containing protein [Rhodocyclaceae bacterium]
MNRSMFARLACISLCLGPGAALGESWGPLGGSGLSGEYARWFPDSPLSRIPLTWAVPGSYLYLENFETGALTTPGVAIAGDELRFNGNDDSVDTDDGVLDGSGRSGHDAWAWSTPGISFTFDAGVLGRLPNFAGIVWTDGVNPIVFEAYDAAGALIVRITGNHADDRFDGTTADDRFYGLRHDPGIARMVIYEDTTVRHAGIEVDHLQYAYAIPEPESAALLLAGLGALGALSRRRRDTRGAP